jgi:hypothetical protein
MAKPRIPPLLQNNDHSEMGKKKKKKKKKKERKEKKQRLQAVGNKKTWHS